MKAVGVDIGTTTISAVVLDVTSWDVVEAKTIQNGSFIKTDQEWERIQDVSVIVRKARETLDELLDKYSDVASIGLTGQMHGILYVDKEGKDVSPLITWQDGRGNLPEFDGETLVAQLRRTCGVPVATGFGLVTHIYHCRKNRIPENSVSFCTIADYLGMYLTGRKTPLVHISNAASMGFFDVRKGKFMDGVLRDQGVDAAMLPEVTDEFAILGNYRDIPVTASLGDNQASFLGSVGMEKNRLLVNMGTGGQISLFSDQYFEAPGIEARPFVKDKYLLVGSSLCGGRAYAILENFFRSYVKAIGAGDSPQYDTMAKLARGGLTQEDPMQVVTMFNGTRVNPEIRGSISNLSGDNFTPEGLIAGVLRGSARELYDMYMQIYEGTGIRIEHLIASGNGLRKNKVLQEIFSSMFNAKLSLAPFEEEAACGAAASSMMVQG